MDEIDRAILYHLQRDGRLANNDLADRIGLSPSPCLRRVRQLEERGIIVGYSARLDPEAVGRGFEALVWVTLTEINHASMRSFEEAVVAVDDVVSVERMYGQPDYLLRVAVAGRREFERCYDEHLATLPFVRGITTQLTMNTVKRSTALPVGPG